MRLSIRLSWRYTTAILNICRSTIILFSCYGVCIAQSDVRKLIRIQYNNLIVFSPKWTVQNDVGLRINGAFQSKSQSFFTSTVGYQLAENVKLYTGMSFIGSYISDEISKLEYRPYEQLTVLDKLKKILTSHRLRVEQRYRHALPHDGHPSVNTLVFRWRYRFQVSVPIFAYNTERALKGLILNFGDEVSYNTGRKYLNHAFDRNRIYSDLILQFSSKFSIAMTYDYTIRRSPGLENHLGRDYLINLGLKHNILLTE